jgi:alcohol dehydrogenase YqhD (iron-dependent ADH family)
MINFTFSQPTRISFGKDVEKQVGQETRQYGTRALLHFGGGSIKRSGLYDRVTESLCSAGVEWVELGGVQPNPRLSLVRQGISLCRESGADIVLAVGGGSVIDSAKAIAAGVMYEGDVWDFYARTAFPEQALPVGVVLTMAAAGSEASNSSVITNEDGMHKVGLSADCLRPRFSLCNPQLTCTVPAYQTACGIADILAHVMERYFTPQHDVAVTDRMCEATMIAIMENARRVMADLNSYEARAEIMWAGTVAHNDILGVGRLGDWSSHRIEHELSAIYDIPHGAGLAIVFPAWMKYVYKHDVRRFRQFAERVFGVGSEADDTATALEGIACLERFFREIGLPVTLSEANIPGDRLDEMAEKCAAISFNVGNYVKLTTETVRQILELAR